MDNKLQALKDASDLAERDFCEAHRFLVEAVQEHRDAARHYDAMQVAFIDARAAWLNAGEAN